MTRNICHWLLVAALFCSQFGCASLPQPTPPAAILENVPTPVAPLLVSAIDHQSFHAKIAELKGKIGEWHRGVPPFDTLALQVDRLDDGQNAVEAGHVESRNDAAVIGAVVVPLAVFGIVQASMSSGSKDLEHLDDRIATGLATLLTIPLQALAGAVIGSSIAKSMGGPNLTIDHKLELARLISAYNSANGTTPAPQASDTAR